MNFWLTAAVVLCIGLAMCGYVCLSGRTMDRLIALELAGVIVITQVVLLAEGTGRPSIYDLALALALLSFPSGIVFAHFLERWL